MGTNHEPTPQAGELAERDAERPAGRSGAVLPDQGMTMRPTTRTARRRGCRACTRSGPWYGGGVMWFCAACQSTPELVPDRQLLVGVEPLITRLTMAHDGRQGHGDARHLAPSGARRRPGRASLWADSRCEATAHGATWRRGPLGRRRRPRAAAAAAAGSTVASVQA